MSRGVRVRSGGGVRVDVNQELKLLKIWWGGGGGRVWGVWSGRVRGLVGSGIGGRGGVVWGMGMWTKN